MPIRETLDRSAFNTRLELPFQLRLADFEMALQDVYDFFYDVNLLFEAKGLPRLDDNLRPAILSGMLSDMITASLARHSRSLVQNTHFNGHPDLVVGGRYPRNAAQAGLDGVEIKTTRKRGGAVDTHGARDQWMCVFVYETDQVDGARAGAPGTALHRGLSGAGGDHRLPPQCPRRARHPHRDAGPARHPETARQLGL